MKKQINKSWQSSLLATIAVVFLFDADGVRVRDESNFIGDEGYSPKPGETTKIYAYKPNEKQMKEVKRITITRRPI